MALAIDERRAERAARTNRPTPRTMAIRAIAYGSHADFEVADAFEAASLRGSVYYTLGRDAAWVEQLSHRTVRVYRHAQEDEHENA